jgi:hypothetical protein
MLDAAERARLLLEHDDVEAALSRSEQDLFPRAAEAARRSAFGLDLIFNADALARPGRPPGRAPAGHRGAGRVRPRRQCGARDR